MDILEIARRRKTVREFKSEKICLEDIIYCIKVAKEAPSGMNSQPWKFLVITDEEKKEEIRKLCEEKEKNFHRKVKGELKEWLKEKRISWKKPFLQNSPAIVIVLSSKRAPYFTQSTWLAIGYFLLALEEKGLATVTYTPPNTEEIRECMGISDDYKIEVIMPVGYSNDKKDKENRKSLEEIFYLNEWKAVVD